MVTEARLEVSIGSVKFLGEGSETWVSEQFKAVLEAVKSMPPAVTATVSSSVPVTSNDQLQRPIGSLATFLREKNVGSSQVNRFLAAAIWLQLGGTKSLKTSDVTKALADAHQQRLSNPADVLNQNVAKGYCVKQGDGFYVTSEGQESLR